MSRRRAVEPAIGLAALDVVCGVFGLLVVLYALTSPFDGARAIADVMLKTVHAEIGEHAARPALALVVDGREYRSWPQCADAGVVRFSECGASAVSAVVQSTGPIEAVRVLVLDLPSEDVIKARIVADGVARVCTLDLAHGYRARIEGSECLPDSGA